MVDPTLALALAEAALQAYKKNKQQSAVKQIASDLADVRSAIDELAKKLDEWGVSIINKIEEGEINVLRRDLEKRVARYHDLMDTYGPDSQDLVDLIEETYDGLFSIVDKGGEVLVIPALCGLLVLFHMQDRSLRLTNESRLRTARRFLPYVQSVEKKCALRLAAQKTQLKQVKSILKAWEHNWGQNTTVTTERVPYACTWMGDDELHRQQRWGSAEFRKKVDWGRPPGAFVEFTVQGGPDAQCQNQADAGRELRGRAEQRSAVLLGDAPDFWKKAVMYDDSARLLARVVTLSKHTVDVIQSRINRLEIG